MKNKFNIMLELSFCRYVYFAVSFSFFFNIANHFAASFFQGSKLLWKQLTLCNYVA